MNAVGTSGAGSGASGPGTERWPRRARIRGGDEIRALLRNGIRRRTPHLHVFVAPDRDGDARFGTIVPKHRRTVVERNLLRRRLREIGRRDVLPALRAADWKGEVLVRAGSKAYDVDFAMLRRELLGITEVLCSESSPLG